MNGTENRVVDPLQLAIRTLDPDSKSDEITNFDAPYEYGYLDEYTTAPSYPEAGNQNALARDAIRRGLLTKFRS